MSRKNNKKVGGFLKLLTFILITLSVATIVMLFLLDILPFKYLIIIISALAIGDLILSRLLLKKRKRKKGSIIFTLILIIILTLILNYGINTLGFLNGLGKNNFKQEDYSVVVLNNSSYKNIDDLREKAIGYIKSDSIGQEKAIKKLKTKIEYDKKEYVDSSSLVDNLFKKNIDAMLIEKAQLEMLYEIDPSLKSATKILYSISIKTKLENKASKINVTKDFFNIYISGIDTYGSVNNVSRSDVNMVLSINPNTHKILITSIPRDYYVSLSGKPGLKDKLTHAGIYGIDTSMNTISTLLDTPIDLYIKVNFSSLIKMVDTLDGIEVNSKYDFMSQDNIHFSKGTNYLNGKEALSFVRERHAFDELGGDRVRGENQQIVLSALIKKAMTPKILTKYNYLLKNLTSSFNTNINNDSITSLITKQLNDNENWSIETINLDGTNGYEYTYSYQSQKLYVMIPDVETINLAKEKINQLSK